MLEVFMSAQKKSQSRIARRHHVIPQLYLAGFTDSGEKNGLLYAHDALYANANNSKGFYRLRDKDGDGKFEDVKLLLRTGGSVGHGRV